MSALPREIVRWLQTLDLPQQVRHPKRDMANGYLAAEICARYWTNVDLHQYDNGTSTRVKESNWKALQKALAKNNATLPQSLVQDVIAAKEDAARALLETLYSMFTNRVVQRAQPLDVPELSQVPTYVKPQRTSDHALQQQLALQQQQQQQQQAQQQQQQDEEAAVMEREAAEAERRRKLNAASSKKPKPAAKVQAIRAADEAENDEDQPKLQFSGVTVKPLSGQALARLGVGRAAATRRSASGPSTADAPRASAGDGVLTSLSSAIETMLRESAAASWPVPPGMTHVEYFAQQHQRLPPAVRDAVWTTLYAAIDDTAAWLVGRPADMGSFAAAFLPGVSTAAVQTQLGRAHFPFTGLDAANSAAYVKTVFSNVAKRRAGYAVATLGRSVMPLVAPMLERYSRVGEPLREEATACVDALCALAGCGVDAPSVAEARVRQFLTSAHQALVAPRGTAASTDSYAGFLLAVDAVTTLPCSGVVPAPSPAERPMTGDTEALDSARSPAEGSSVARSDDAMGGAGASGDVTAPTGRHVLHAGVAAAVHYHAVAALHHPSGTVRVLGLRLLTRLAEFGRVASVIPRHIERLTALTDRDAVAALALVPDALAQSLALLRHSIAGVAALRQRDEDNELAGDADEQNDVAAALEAEGALVQIALAVCRADGSEGTLLATCATTDRLHVLAEMGAAADHLPAVPAADGEASPQQLAVHSVVQALHALPQPLQLLLTLGENETVPDAATLLSQFGVRPPRLAHTAPFHGAPESWPALAVVSILVQVLAQAQFEPPALPAPTKGSRVKVAANDAQHAEELAAVSHTVELLFQFVVRRTRPLCPAAQVALGWEIMRIAWAPLAKGSKYVEQVAYLRRKGVAIPPESEAHAAMRVIARRCRCIVFRLFAEWSGVPAARSIAGPTLEKLAANIHGDETADDPEEGADRVSDWWQTTVQPEQPAAES